MFILECKGMETFSIVKKYGIPRNRHFSNRFTIPIPIYYVCSTETYM